MTEKCATIDLKLRFYTHCRRCRFVMRFLHTLLLPSAFCKPFSAKNAFNDCFNAEIVAANGNRLVKF